MYDMIRLDFVNYTELLREDMEPHGEKKGSK